MIWIGTDLTLLLLMFGILLALVVYWVAKFVISLWTGA